MKKSILVFTYIFIITLFCLPVLGQNTLIISDGSYFENKHFYPKFNWKTTPMYYMFGDSNRVLTPQEIEHIAERTNFICIEKSHGLRQLGAAELGAKHDVAAFKKVKPDIKVLFYFNSAYAWPFTSYNKAFTRENIEEHPELKKFLIIDSETKELEHRRNTFFFDVLNPEFRDWWVNTVAKGVEFSGADGAFIDQMHGFAWLRKDKSKEVEQAMGDMMAALKTKLGPNKILLGNNAHDKIAQYVFPVIDANMFEHYKNALLSKESLLKDWENMLRIAKAGKISIFRIGVESDSKAQEEKDYYRGRLRNKRLAELSKEKLEYYHACYLIGAQPYSYFQYGWGWQLAHGSLLDYPELQKPLGSPKGAYTRTSPNAWEFTREYEHAKVWVNTETRESKINWK
ncbi:putative glycoside hydrolase [Flavivirga aquimarina]|uniref:Glycoside hydrolase n=1 Tax=Flavivirga aquimarina TaxID=2027862 RepID=A0ABT8W5F3_9FLAO|nr:putative glycoside hydrolase [Flavivirga aquimarina]MDO5968344.1 putative glycoside hydrolase [Flavivirga aquimarina]